MGVNKDRVFSAGWFWLACTRRPGRDVAGEGECYIVLRSVRGSVLLVLLRHRGDGGCKLGFWGAGEGRATDGRRSTHLHGIRRYTRRLEIRFAPPPPSIPTSLPFIPNCTPAWLAHPPESLHLDDHCQCFTTCKSHCITTHHNTPWFVNAVRTYFAYVCWPALLCPCAFFGCDLLTCMRHLIFSFLWKHTSAALRHVCLCTPT